MLPIWRYEQCENERFIVSRGDAVKRPRFWWLPFGDVNEISARALKSWLDSGSPVQLLDARTGAEYGGGTIAGARHAPVTALPGLLDQLELDPERPVVVLCATGHRSRPWARLLKARGMEAYSLKGGLLAWRSAGYPLSKESAAD